MNKVDCRRRGARVRGIGLAVVALAMVAGVMPGLAQSRPPRAPVTRAERRAARALAQPVPPPARPAVRPRQLERLGTGAPTAAAPAAAAAATPAKRDGEPPRAVQQATLETEVPKAAERGEDGMFSVLVRPGTPAATQPPEPLTFPEDPRPVPR